jgi:hypothetical protein
MIPTYTFDGARLRDYSLQSIEWLLALDSITVRRKHGRILSARFRSRSRQVVPCRGTAVTCARFTHKERIGKTKSVIHNPLPPEERTRERERRLKLAAARRFEARMKLVGDLPVAA